MRRKLYMNLPWAKYHELNKQHKCDTKTKAFQIKILHRFQPTDYVLQRMGLVTFDLCSLCKTEVETIQHLFVDCVYSGKIWMRFEKWSSEKFDRCQLHKCWKVIRCFARGTSAQSCHGSCQKHIYFCRFNEKLPHGGFACIHRISEISRNT